jgi:hypothetical protein
MKVWPAPIDHAYILCSERFEPERYKTLKDWLDKNEMDPKCYTFVYFKHGSELTADEAFKAYNPWTDRPSVPLEERNFNRYNLKLSEISVGINWGYSALAAVKGGHPNAVLMLESDPVFEENFLEKLAEAMNKLNAREWDFLSIGDGVGMKVQRPVGDNALAWFPAPGFYHTRTCDAMIFKTSMLKKIVTTYFPFAEIIDWELNYHLQRHGSKSFWLDPIIVKNGSCSGATKTTL